MDALYKSMFTLLYFKPLRYITTSPLLLSLFCLFSEKRLVIQENFTFLWNRFMPTNPFALSNEINVVTGAVANLPSVCV